MSMQNVRTLQDTCGKLYDEIDGLRLEISNAMIENRDQKARIAKLEAALRQSVEDMVVIRERVSGILHDCNANWERQRVELRICDDAATKARKALEE